MNKFAAKRQNLPAQVGDLLGFRRHRWLTVREGGLCYSTANLLKACIRPAFHFTH